MTGEAGDDGLGYWPGVLFVVGTTGDAGEEEGLGYWLGTEPVSVTGQMVVEMATVEVTTVVWVWLSGCAGQFVTVGWQEVIVTSVVV